MRVVQALGGFITAFALACSAREPGARLYQQWQRADTDADGRLSRVEARAMPSLAQRFEALDADRDGFLTAEEIRAARSRSRQRRRPYSGVETLMATADRNADGVLARGEVDAFLPRLATRFADIDADADGALSRAELEAWLALRRAVRSTAR